MKTNSMQQEILLMTGTSFSARQYATKNDELNQAYLSEIEQLKEACWNGLLPQMLPEIYIQEDGMRKIYLWQIKENKCSIEIVLSEIPEEIEKFFSLDPYSFLSVQLLS